MVQYLLGNILLWIFFGKEYDANMLLPILYKKHNSTI